MLKRLLKLGLLLILIFTLFWYAFEVQYPSVGFGGSPQEAQPLLSILFAIAGTLTVVKLYSMLRNQPARLRTIVIIDIALLLLLAVVRS